MLNMRKKFFFLDIFVFIFFTRLLQHWVSGLSSNFVQNLSRLRLRKLTGDSVNVGVDVR